MSRWFRMHDEILDDPKVQRLSGDDFKGWVNLLCLASRNNGKLPSIEDVAFALRETEESVSSLFHRLQSAGLIVLRNGRYEPYKWAERQYKSDTSTDRVKRFRQRSRNGGETAPEAETDTETEVTPIIPLAGGRGGKSFIPEDWKAPLVSELPPRSRACAEQWTEASYQTEAEAFVCYWRSERKMKGNWRDTWCNRIVARHSAVMRDQKFGNGAPAVKKEMTAQEWRERAEWYVRHGQPDNAEECRRKAIALETRQAA